MIKWKRKKNVYEHSGKRHRLLQQRRGKNEAGRTLRAVEFFTTIRYIEKYLRPEVKILENGAGPGRNSHYFARQGYAIDAVELVPRNIEQFKADTRPGETITVVRGDARNLSSFEDGRYDITITLVLGPLYPLPGDEDKRTALSEALRVTKSGGIVFAAYILNEATVINYLFRRDKIAIREITDRVEKSRYQMEEIPEKNLCICKIEDINRVMTGFPAERLHLVGTDMVSGMIRDLLSELDDVAFCAYLDYIQTICERPDMIGISGHILDIFRKNA